MPINEIIYVFAVQFFAFIIKGAVGFGNPLVSSPLLAMKFNNSVITPGNLLLDLPVNVWMVIRNRRSFIASVTLPIAFFCVLGVIPGVVFLKSAPPFILKAILGVFIIGLGIEMATRGEKRKRAKPSRFVLPLVSFVSGIMSGLFGVNMLFLAYLERVTDNREQFLSNVCFVFVIDGVFRTVVYLIGGIFTAASLELTAISVPAAFLGVFIGNTISKHMNDAFAKRAVIAVFILGGAAILLKALILRA